MKKLLPLNPSQLSQKTDARHFKFKTTADIQENVAFVGQSRAVEAMQFSVGIQKDGYNLYAMGSSGVGKRTVVFSALEEEAKHQKVPSDWCYLYNFEDAQKPIALRLPAGFAKNLSHDMETLVEDICTSIPIIFESKEYRTQMQKISDTLTKHQEKILNQIKLEAEKQGLIIVSSTEEFTILPADKQGRAISAEKFARLDKKKRDKKDALILAFTEQLTDFLKDVPRVDKKQRAKEKELKKKFALLAVAHFFDDLKKKYKSFKAVIRYLDAVQNDVIEHAHDFLKRDEATQTAPANAEKNPLTRYQVNVLVNNAHTKGAPVIYEENPTYANLIYRMEYVTQFGTLSTDFTLIKAGALHRANGGYLILDAAKVLQDASAWEGLKRALYARKMILESPEPATGAFSTLSLEPKPIPLHVKVILLGDRLLHYSLCEADPDFNELFKVAADFEDDIPRTPENLQRYAQFIATLINNDKLLAFDRKAIAFMIDYSARLAEDAEKLSVHIRSIHDLVCEADYWARLRKQNIVQVEDIKQAINAKIHRLDRSRESMYEEIQKKIMLIDLGGKKTGQVNGLVIAQLSSFSFGYPCRITATAHVGEGEIIDIQRETDMGGAIHAKGVLILSGFLAERYMKNAPFSLSASVVFEQTYSEVDGDSASVAELCALISAIAGVPLKQSFAVTGSINQHGDVQAVGGVNEKIEGFFDVCKASGLTGEQGVIIPMANATRLMLKDEVVTAVTKKKFHVYAVNKIDEVLELLSELPAGQRGKNGKFPIGSVNAKAEQRLSVFARAEETVSKRRHK